MAAGEQRNKQTETWQQVSTNKQTETWQQVSTETNKLRGP
jgi:hypothetical protein